MGQLDTDQTTPSPTAATPVADINPRIMRGPDRLAANPKKPPNSAMETTAETKYAPR